MTDLEIGITATAETTVREEDLARAVGFAPGDDFPDVFATTRMIALMEVASARALLPLLKDGEMSVGVVVDVQHTAATPAGSRVRAEARFRGMDGKLYTFDVTAHDEGGEIGRGTHKRAIVSAARLAAGAAKRRAG